MLITGKRFMSILPIVFILLASACKFPQVPNCVPSSEDKGCVLESGSFSLYRIGMSKNDVFQAVCAQEVGERSVLALYVGINERIHYRTSICDLREEALSSDIWIFVDPDHESRYVELHFANERLLKVVLKPRGNDP